MSSLAKANEEEYGDIGTIVRQGDCKLQRRRRMTARDHCGRLGVTEGKKKSPLSSMEGSYGHCRMGRRYCYYDVVRAMAEEGDGLWVAAARRCGWSQRQAIVAEEEDDNMGGVCIVEWFVRRWLQDLREVAAEIDVGKDEIKW
ncbi:hypothetical protein BHE74_00004393 [Ensete ventricosum]|nr:hypothetical protein BHE74_00004393 [Ensete ventricosum]RZR97812.1 hypothetical protein BHM03_00027054 [Ensete ventricosum]